ncbi:replication/maintenance protein RepL [Kitasatospora sp. NPDC098663]|uniref:replication/maintenance protein RepL n=1 Tax=Kitasatospora sp. NPDC098663 TaxID=3364096 RepID=UPI00382946FF
MPKTPPSIPRGMHMVIRPTKDGLQWSLRRSAGFDFVADGATYGYVLDATLLHSLLAAMDMPGTWFRTWHAFSSLQSVSEKGEIKATQERLCAVSGLSRTHIAEAMTYYIELGWLRRIKNGRYALNPWLTFSGNSGEQERQQNAWIEAAGAEFTIPAPDHPAQWRAERERARQAKRDAERAGRVVQLRPRQRTAASRQPGATSTA